MRAYVLKMPGFENYSSSPPPLATCGCNSGGIPPRLVSASLVREPFAWARVHQCQTNSGFRAMWNFSSTATWLQQTPPPPLGVCKSVATVLGLVGNSGWCRRVGGYYPPGVAGSWWLPYSRRCVKFQRKMGEEGRRDIFETVRELLAVTYKFRKMSMFFFWPKMFSFLGKLPGASFWYLDIFSGYGDPWIQNGLDYYSPGRPYAPLPLPSFGCDGVGLRGGLNICYKVWLGLGFESCSPGSPSLSPPDVFKYGGFQQ